MTKEQLWKMFQQLSLGSDIKMGDDHNSRINKLAQFKLKLETALKGHISFRRMLSDGWSRF